MLINLQFLKLIMFFWNSDWILCCILTLWCLNVSSRNDCDYCCFDHIDFIIIVALCFLNRWLIISLKMKTWNWSFILLSLKSRKLSANILTLIQIYLIEMLQTEWHSYLYDFSIIIRLTRMTFFLSKTCHKNSRKIFSDVLSWKSSLNMFLLMLFVMMTVEIS